MAAYVDYTYYTDTYKGTAIASAEFDRLALRASETVDLLTYDQAAAVVDADTDTALISKIKLAVCAVAEEIRSAEGGGGKIQSEKVGSYAITYATSAPKSNLSTYRAAAKLYLGSTGLMYGGPAVS